MIDNAQLPAAQPAHLGQIGPNAITRLAESMCLRQGEAACQALFAQAGLLHHLSTPPTKMVDEKDAARLQRALHERLGPQRAAEVAQEAGALTGDYLLAHRIPRPAQKLLRLLPRAAAARMLVSAVARHAWTFAGSGSFSYQFRDGSLWLRLKGGPICSELHTQGPACHYYLGTFSRVFGSMLGSSVRVVEVACEAAGAEACLFRLDW